jgi:hypothetical protein
MQKLEISTTENSELINLKLDETINIQTLDLLIQSKYLQTDPWINPQTGEKVCYDNEKEHLLKLRKITKNNTMTTIYKPSKLGVGRVYANKSLSLGSIRREIRHTLAHDIYVDIDVENCHPVILKQLCDMNGTKCKYLSQYVTNRAKYLKEVMDKYDVSRDTAKNLFIRLLYFGKIENWKDENAIVEDETLPFLTKFYEELSTIGNIIIMNNPTLHNLIKKQTKTNITASVVSTVLQHYEKKVLETVFKYLKQKQIITTNAVLCFDGIMIPKQNYNSALLTELSKEVKETLGFNLVFTTKEMTEGYDVSEIEDKKSFQYIAKQFEKNICKIVEKVIYIKHTDEKIITFSPTALHNAYSDMTYGADKQSFINAWMNKNDDIRKYDDMNFYPRPLICPSNHFNAWIPFKFENNTTPYQPNKEGLEFLFKHIETMCDHNKEVAQYYIYWLAQMVQYPSVKSVCLTFVGKEGTGKSTLIRLIEHLIGKNKVFETTNPSRDIWGDFNKQMFGAFVVSIPELKKQDYQKGESIFKGLITDPTFVINGKQENALEINSYHRVITTSNKDDPINTSKDDRRNVIIRCSDEFIYLPEKEKEAYFNKVYSYLCDDTIMRTLYDYLMNVPNMDHFKKIPLPKTEHQEQLRKLDMSIPEQFISDMIETAGNANEITLTSDEVFNKFIKWRDDNHVEYETSKPKFGVKLSLLKINGMSNRHTKKGNVRVFDVKILKKHFGIQPDFMLCNDNHILDLDDI